ncbi:MAG: ABC transporter permease, partial [Lachnospiraceae bacterium]|nr:ABC transporter permease [Lachnospiraceae bacterium]
MLRFIIKRVLIMIPTVICVAIIIFTIMYLCPGDPAKNILGTSATESELQAQRELMGLADPYIVQLKNFLVDLFIHLDPGTSWISGLSVTYELRTRIPITLTLALSSMALTILLGVPIGVTAAVNQNKLADRICMMGSMVLISVPNFWLAIEMVLLFTLKLGWLPGYGIGGPKYWIMPVLASMLGGLASNARQTRSAMLEVIRSDYIATARAKGMPEWRIRYQYALPNA